MTINLKSIKLSITVLLFVMIATISYGQTEVQIPANMDNTLYENSSGAVSNGAGGHFFAGRSGQSENSIRRGLISFDIAGNIPEYAVIESVTLTLNMSKTTSGAQDISLHKVLAEWGEGTSDASGQEGGGTTAATSDATWIYRLYNTDLWTTEGGDFSSSPSATIPVNAVGSYTWGSTEQMVADVQSWLDNPSESLGWILVGDESASKTSKRFDSRENENESNRPVLSVTYTPVETAMIDRFSMEAGNLFIRDESNGLPGPNEPVDFDKEPFITKGLGPDGEFISYYNFDAQPTEPAPIYVLFREGESSPVAGQMNIINVIPGDEGYNDFWEVQKVTVPSDYVANSVTSYSQIMDAGYTIEETSTLVNCPVVPEGSTAKLRLAGESPELTQGWYKGMIVYYFNFVEKELMTDESDMVPLSPIYVSFNINPNEPGGGPPSGFVTDPATGRTHNVTATLPMDENYSPLWLVNAYDNADWADVHDLASAQSANILGMGIATVNCPVVAQYVNVDRFSMDAGHLFIRDESNGLPGPNEPIDFDQGPFITKGLGPNGELIAYYNFDVQPTEPAPIYVLFREGETSPVFGQMNIIDVIPGDEGYNDFWEVQKVTVPSDYVANSVTSYSQIMDAGYSIEETTTLVNCPVVPEGSTARLRLGSESTGLTKGWYKGMIVYYFNFVEKELMTDASDMVPLSPIYVSFNINPNEPGGGPPSGFVTDPATGRTHNVTVTLPMDENYSPLWLVNAYDNADWVDVHDLASAQSANILGMGIATVNCPVVAQYTEVDRFSMEAGNLFIRDESNGLPGPNEPVDFDKEPFITKGLGPDGEFISYYNFDVQPTEPAPIYVLFREGESSPVEGQMNIINVIPGDEGYSDFWEVQKVTVPSDYEANNVTSYLQIINNSGYPVEETSIIVNCPVVPEGSTAELRLADESPELTKGWYKGKIVYYFNFAEKDLMTDESDMVPLSPIYVSFNINPGEPGGGPPSGFVTDPQTGRTHNVTSTLPMDEDYSPLWRVNVYDNADWASVHDLVSAQSANILATGVANVNCPVVFIDDTTPVENEDGTAPLTYSLDQNYPNPFNPSTKIQFSIANRGQVTLRIYNILGEQIAELINNILQPGTYSVSWDARGLSTGLYLYSLNAGSFKVTKKMLLLK